MKKSKLLLIVSLVLALTMSLGGTLAYLTDTDEAVNVMTLGNVDIEQYEKDADGKPFEQSQPLYPAYIEGEKITGAIDKIVTVENTGSSDAHIRTWIAFEAGDCANYEALKELIKITFDESVAGQETWLSDVYEIDGQKYCVAYFVYDAVKPDAIVKSLESFYMVPTAGNKEVAQFGNTYEVLVLSQAVQTNNFVDAAQALTAAFGNEHPWKGKDIAELPTVVVKTAADLKAALEEGGTTVVLGADIAIDADNTITIAAGKSARLDLAGHTLSGVADGTGNREMFLVKGNLTVNDGTMEMSATQNQGWGAMTTIFDVTAGGVLNLNGVTAKNLGGTDMAFVAHLNNWGEVTLNVNDSHLQSTYCAVRVFNSGYDMNNVNIHNSTIWGDNRSFWVHNYIGDLDSNKHSDEAIKARLNFDIEDESNRFVGRLAYGFANEDNPDVDFTPIYNTQTKLEAALDEGKTDLLVAAGTYTFPASKIQAGTTITCAEGTVFEGKSSLDIKGATVIGASFENENDTAVAGTINGTFKDCTFTGTNGLRWCYAGETVVFENCVFSGSTYGAHFDGGANEVIFKNCTFSGFNAMAGAITKLTLNGCTFKANGESNYNGINLWGNTDLIDCTFVFDGTAGTEWVHACAGDGDKPTAIYNFTNCVVKTADGEHPLVETSEFFASRNAENVINFN